MAVSAADLMVTFKADTKQAEAGIQRVNKGITGFAKSAASVGAGILGAQAFGVITKGFSGATAGALEFNKQIQNIASIAPDINVSKLTDDVLKLTSDPRIAQAPAELAAGLYDIQSSGFDAAHGGMDVLAQSALAATAGITTTATAARVITANLNAFGYGADQSRRVSDVLFQTVADGVVTFDQLANNMGNVIPNANALGLSIEEVGAAYAQMTLKGVNASIAETQINALMRSALNPTDKLTAAVQKHGYASAEAAIKTGGFAEFLGILSEESGGSSESLLDLLGTADALNAAQILGAKGAKAYRKELDRMSAASKGAGATNKALEKQTQSAAFQIDKMKQQVQTLATVGFGILAPAIGKAASVMTRFLSRGVIPFTKAIGQAFKGGFAFNKLLTQLPQPLRRAAHAVGVMAESIGDMIRGGISRNELTQFFHGFQAFVDEAAQGVHFVANFVIDAAAKLGELLIDGITATPGAIYNWVKNKLFGGGGSISQDPASPMYGQQQTIDVGVLDVAAKIGSILAEKGENLINGLATQILAWTSADHPKLEAVGIDVDSFSPTFADLAKSDFDQAVKDALTADPIKVTPEIQLQIHDAVENWVRDQAGTNPLEGIDFGQVFTVARWAALVPGFTANLPAAITTYFASKAGTDIANTLKAAISGAIAGAFTDRQVFERPGYPGTYTEPGLFSGIIDTIETGISGAINAWVPDFPDIGNKVMVILGTDWVDALAKFTTSFKPDFGFIGDAVQTALDAIPKPSLPDWMTDFSWITGPIETLKGYISDLIGVKNQAFAETYGPAPGLTGRGGVASQDPASPYYNYVPTMVAPAFPDPTNQQPQGLIKLNYTFVPAAGGDDPVTKIQSAVDNINQSKTAKIQFDADTSKVAKAYTDVFTWGDAWAKQTFESTFDVDNGPTAQKYTESFNWGSVWDKQTFTSTFDADDGPAAIAYTEAFGWGNTWAGQVFTAHFAIDTSGLWAALAVAQTVAAGIAALMPHSPAKVGPLSKPIHFDFIANAAHRDLSGLPNQLARYLTANGRIGLRGPGRGGPTITVNALRSDELIRLFRNAEAGGSLAHNFHRDLGLSGGA